VAQAQQELATLLEAEGQPDAAAALYAEALPVYRRELGSAHGQTANLLTSLAALRCEDGEAEAVSLYEEALALERERLGGADETLSTIWADLRACRRTLGR
jgi:tetratricopeptide (TPR) repeat protein